MKDLENRDLKDSRKEKYYKTVEEMKALGEDFGKVDEDIIRERPAPSKEDMLNYRERLRSQQSEEEDLVENQYPRDFYAGFFIRFFAYLLDAMVVGSLSTIVLRIYYLIRPEMILGLTYKAFLFLLVQLVYFTLTTYFTNGQTLGKIVFGLRVVSFREERLKFSTVFVRETLGRIIHQGPLVILYIITGLTSKKQNLSDIFADTSVVAEKVLDAYRLGETDQPSRA